MLECDLSLPRSLIILEDDDDDDRREPDVVVVVLPDTYSQWISALRLPFAPVAWIYRITPFFATAWCDANIPIAKGHCFLLHCDIMMDRHREIESRLLPVAIRQLIGTMNTSLIDSKTV